MSFENPQLELSDLPEFQESQYQVLEPRYLKVMRIGALLFSLFLLIAAGGIVVASKSWSSTLLLLIVGGIWLILSLTSFLLTGPAFHQKGYAIRARDISYKTGLISRRVTTIPFNRVQHCDIKQGVISRYFGLSKLNVYTAGGAKSDLSIPGLAPEKAAKVMDFVLQKTLTFDEEE